MKELRIAFVISLKHPGITQDDVFLVEALAKHRWDCVAVAWDSPSVDWNSFDRILLRSPWNYHLLPHEFSRWIASVPQERLVNPPELVLWNMDKRYLKRLRDHGVRMPATIWLDEIGETIPGEDLFTRSGFAIVKPSISASSFQTSKITRRDLKSVMEHSSQRVGEGGMMVQEYIEEVLNGEISMMYFGNTFSHAVLKEPKPGDFRVQAEFGGTVKPIQVSPQLIEQGLRILSLLPCSSLYARIDGVECNGDFVLMEVELIEPVLFFGLNPSSVELFATVLKKSLK